MNRSHRSTRLPLSLCLLLSALCSQWALAVNEDDLGAWYMLFANKTAAPEGHWGLQGDLQYRNWDLLGDLEQLLMRGGLTWTPDSRDVLLTLGLAHVISGEFGSSSDTSNETRIYQEALLPHRIGNRLYLRHRFRYEQRWVEDQDFRSRYRYALFADIPINRSDLGQGAWYVALYNEVFLNGERNIGDGRKVDTFDRNRSYAGIGYALGPRMKLQFGVMHQHSTVDKTQLQFSLHQSF